MKARIVDQVVEERDISRSKPFKNISSTKRHAQPQTFGARTGKEGAPGKAFRVDGVVQVEVPHIADVLDVIEKKWDHSPRKIEQLNPAIADEGRQRQVPGKCFASEAADDDLFVGGRHGTPGLSHGSDWRREKVGSPVANTLLLCYTYDLLLRLNL